MSGAIKHAPGVSGQEAAGTADGDTAAVLKACHRTAVQELIVKMLTSDDSEKVRTVDPRRWCGSSLPTSVRPDRSDLLMCLDVDQAMIMFHNAVAWVNKTAEGLFHASKLNEGSPYVNIPKGRIISYYIELIQRSVTL